MVSPYLSNIAKMELGVLSLLVLCGALSQSVESSIGPWPEYRGGPLNDGASSLAGPASPVDNVTFFNLVTRLNGKGKLLSAPVMDEENNVLILSLDGTLIVFSPSDTNQKSYTTIPLSGKHPWTVDQLTASCNVVLSGISTIKNIVSSQFAPPLAVLGGGRVAVLSPVDGYLYFVNYKNTSIAPKDIAFPDAGTPSCFAPTVIDEGRLLLVAVNSRDRTSGQVLLINMTAVEQGDVTTAIIKTFVPNVSNRNDQRLAFTSSISVGPAGVGIVPFTTVVPSNPTSANVFTFLTDPSQDAKPVYMQVDQCTLPYLGNAPAAIWVRQ